MSKEVIFSPQVTPPIGPYSQAILANDFLYISGQIAPDFVNESIEKEAQKVMDNLKAILDKASFDFKDIVKTTILLSDIALFEKVNQVYATYFNEADGFPARETYAVQALPKNVNVEISAIARKKNFIE